MQPFLRQCRSAEFCCDNMFKNTSYNLKLFLWAVISGLVTATITANLGIPIFPGWEAPLVESGMTSNQLYGAKAATLAVLGAASLSLALISIPSIRPILRTDFLVGVTSAVSAFSAGWFWLLGETEGNPVPFLIALVPALAWMSVAVTMGMILGEAIKADRKDPPKLQMRIVLLVIGSVAMTAGIFALMYLLPSRLF